MAQVVLSRDREWVAGLICRFRVWVLGPILVPVSGLRLKGLNDYRCCGKNGECHGKEHAK